MGQGTVPRFTDPSPVPFLVIFLVEKYMAILLLIRLGNGNGATAQFEYGAINQRRSV